MIELYHGEPTADSLKLLICLKEKRLNPVFHYVDTDKWEQWSDAHRQLAPQGQLPILVDGGEVMTEAAFALQYLAEAYPDPRLAPMDAVGWYDLQAWNSTNDAALATNVSLLGWTDVTTPETRTAYRQRLATIPGRQKPAGWAAVVADAEANEDQLALARERIGEAVGRIEGALAPTGWLIGADYSIADINSFALTHTLPRLLPDLVNPTATPRMVAWLQRIGDRPAVKAALATRRTPAGQDVYAAPT